MASSEPTPCGGRFIKDFVEHSRDCVRCADAALFGKVQCGVCGLAMYDFNEPEHMRMHSGEKPFRCAVCLQAFARKQDLSTHLRRHYNQRPFACTTCDKTFRAESDLAQHLSAHTMERPFACRDCAKTYKFTQDLTRHKRQAHGYSYPCRRCHAEFATRNELVAHYVRHRKAGPLKQTN